MNDSILPPFSPGGGAVATCMSKMYPATLSMGSTGRMRRQPEVRTVSLSTVPCTVPSPVARKSPPSSVAGRTATWRPGQSYSANRVARSAASGESRKTSPREKPNGTGEHGGRRNFSHLQIRNIRRVHSAGGQRAGGPVVDEADDRLHGGAVARGHAHGDGVGGRLRGHPLTPEVAGPGAARPPPLIWPAVGAVNEGHGQRR
eukprot:292609-Prorocentrum_minimum.AAC.2